MRALLLPLMAIFLAGCDEMDLAHLSGSDRYREDFHFSFPLTSGGSLRVDNSNGSVEISAWDKNTIDIDGTKFANSEYRLKEMKIDIVPSPNAITIRTIPPIDHRGNAGARYTIHVPRHTELAGIVSSNGAIRIDDVEGAAHLRTSNGSVKASGIAGSLEAQTSNGSIEIMDMSGDASLRTSNGSIRAEIRKGRFAAKTSNGSITARLKGSDSSPVRAESSNGHIELTLDDPREVHASTTNSSITVRMPSNADATLDAHTSNSSVSCDFDVTVHGEMRTKHSLSGTIGKGGPLLDLGTSNGSIRVLKL